MDDKFWNTDIYNIWGYKKAGRILSKSQEPSHTERPEKKS